MRIHRFAVHMAVLGAAVAAGRAQSADLARVREAARAEVALGTAPGVAVAVVHEGRVVMAEGFGAGSVDAGSPVTADTVFQVGSVGKMLTAAAVLDVAADGGLPLTAPVGRVVSGLDSAIGALTPHQLLSQTSGLRDMPGEHGDQDEGAHGRFLRSLTAADRLFVPGQAFSYSNVGYSLAGFAAAEAARTTYADLMASRVFTPLGMTRSTLRPTVAMTWPLAVGHRRGADGAFTVVRPLANDTRLWPAGYAYSTAADLARFARALLRNERRIEVMTAAHAELPLLFGGAQYGYGLILYTSRGVRVAEHAGSMPGYAALVRLVPEHGFAVVVLSNGETPALRTADAAMEALLPLQGPAPPPVDAPPVPIRRAEMEVMAGRYENRGAFVLAIESGRLVLRQNGGTPLTVARVGPDRYIATGPDNRPALRFIVTPALGASPAMLRFALWAYRKVS